MDLPGWIQPARPEMNADLPLPPRGFLPGLLPGKSGCYNARMGYLLLAIGCSAAIALIFKHSETSGLNRYAVTSANYLTACTVSVIHLTIQGFPAASWPEPGVALEEIGRALAGGNATLSVGASLYWAALVGLGAGTVFFLAFVFYQISVRDHGVSLAGAFAKLGILVPMSLSLLLWQELPGAVQWAGIGLAVASIMLVNWPVKGRWRGAVRPALLLLFVLGGLAEFSNKVFQKYGQVDVKTVFLLTTFSVALLGSLTATLRTRRQFGLKDVIVGCAVGVPNLYSSFFLIEALQSIRAAVAFPVYAAGSIVIINLGGVFLFGERLNRREQLAVGLTVVALILINLR